MSRAASPRPAWLRSALILLVLLGAVLAPAEATPAPALAPPAAVSTEPNGEAHQDTADSALRVTTRRPALGATPLAHPREPRRSRPLPTRGLSHVPAPRSVVLRC
ncbi:hypothetical protein AB0E78_05520 [Streptomyces sp. NPDC032198]|uniref:hypothetical protein n=1 Tax=Streptomyces sp. NPDC032198 TaxID=3155127 RepID=UPI0034088ACB